jgi:hypothetical protein
MKIRMLVDIAGTRNGVEWPPRGESIDLPEQEALDYIAAGLAEADATPGPAKVTETAAVEPVKETAARKPGRPRKTAE